MNNVNDKLELILQRAVDRCAKRDDWRMLEAARQNDPDLDRVVVDALRDADALRLALAPAISSATMVEVPLAARRESRRASASVRTKPFFLGMLTAALLLVTCYLVLEGPELDTARREKTEVANAGATNAEDLIHSFIAASAREGRSVEALPLVTLGLEPGDDDKPVLLVLRRFVERSAIDHVQRLALDEYGEAIAMPVSSIQVPVSRKL